MQIYEPILGDRDGRADDRPADGDPVPQGQPAAAARIRQGDAPARTIGVYGEAARDADFAGAGDRVRYDVAVPAGGVYTVEAELRYQPIGYRWAHNLERYDAAEPKRFCRLLHLDVGELVGRSWRRPRHDSRFGARERPTTGRALTAP